MLPVAGGALPPLAEPAALPPADGVLELEGAVDVPPDGPGADVWALSPGVTAEAGGQS